MMDNSSFCNLHVKPGKTTTEDSTHINMNIILPKNPGEDPQNEGIKILHCINCIIMITQ